MKSFSDFLSEEPSVNKKFTNEVKKQEQANCKHEWRYKNPGSHKSTQQDTYCIKCGLVDYYMGDD
jgi:hypothetical protein